LEINSVSAYGWRAYEEIQILLGFSAKVLSCGGIFLCKGPKEQGLLDTLNLKTEIISEICRFLYKELRGWINSKYIALNDGSHLKQSMFLH
jgi:hypothetical protein